MLETIVLAAIGLAVLALLARHFYGMFAGRKTGCWCGEPCTGDGAAGSGRSCPAREICPVVPKDPGTVPESEEPPA